MRYRFKLVGILLALALAPPAALCARMAPASAPEAEAEREALLALWSSTGSSAVLEKGGWRPSPAPAPCHAAPLGWKYINCSAEGRVVSVQLTPQSGVGGLRGSIPWDRMTSLQMLTSFTLSQQSMTGPALAPAISALSHLSTLVLAANTGLSGSIPAEVSSLSALRLLDLSINAVSSSLPATLANCTALTGLALQQNLLTGSIPDSLSSLSHLSFLFLAHNHMDGSLPPSLPLALTALSSLQLAFNKYVGEVPSSWANFSSKLQNLELSTNQLAGLFPTALLHLTSLTKLDISYNRFYGPVPQQLWDHAPPNTDISSNYFNGSLPSNPSPTILYNDNCFQQPLPAASASLHMKSTSACTAYYQSVYPVPPPPAPVVYQDAPPSSSSSSTTGLIVGIVVGVTALLLLVAAVLFWRYRSQERIARRLRKGVTQSTREFTLAELKTATNNWSTVVGRGGYGTVYKAVLKDGTAVAVKRLDQVSDQGDAEFIREVELLSRVHHRHLVNLLGFCGEKGERALVYEYMALGSLYEHLHGECAMEQPLSWDSRIKIAIHIAFGIDYLHYGADPPLIHRDIKSGNILLSDDGYAKVADFGLCKEAPVGVSTDGKAELVPPATEVRGSFGYLDPEYVNTSVLSEKSDVYSYGVVLLELITGKKSIHDWQPLAYWAEPFLEDPSKLQQLVDPALGEEYDAQELQILCDIARSCVYDQAAKRPAIRDVAQALVENLGRVVSSSASDSITERSTISSELASSRDPSESTGVSGTYSSDYSFRNAASEALLVGLRPAGQNGDTADGAERGKGAYFLATGPDGTKPPVPVGKRFEDTI